MNSDPTNVSFYVPNSLIRDHLYESCPALQRDGIHRKGVLTIDMLAYLENGVPGDVCGWCVRVWKARNR